MPYRLVLSDIDGTLLNDRGELSARCAAAIRAARERGITFTLATGRAAPGVRGFLPLVSSGAPVILYNGGVIVSSGSGETLYSRCVLPEAARRVLRLFDDFGADFVVWADGRLFSNSKTDEVAYYGSVYGLSPEPFAGPSALTEPGVTKLLMIDSPERIAEFELLLRRAAPEHVHACTSTPNYLEIFDDRVSKGEALKRLCSILGVTPEETVAVGDAHNDVSMLEAAGLGVAMGNAPEDVKARAARVTLSNEEDGLAALLDSLV